MQRVWSENWPCLSPRGASRCHSLAFAFLHINKRPSLCFSYSWPWIARRRHKILSIVFPIRFQQSSHKTRARLALSLTWCCENHLLKNPVKIQFLLIGSRQLLRRRIIITDYVGNRVDTGSSSSTCQPSLINALPWESILDLSVLELDSTIKLAKHWASSQLSSSTCFPYTYCAW